MVLFSGTSLYAPFLKVTLVDKPGRPMPRLPETFGGEVEHQIYMLQGIILLVVELKLAIKDEMDYVAQVFLELICE